MKTPTVRRLAIHSLLPLLFSHGLLAEQSPATPSPQQLAEQDARERDRARLAQASVLLLAVEASDRLAGLNEIVHRAAGAPTIPVELEGLLLQAARDPDPSVAELASRTLDLSNPSAQLEAQSDEAARELSDERRLRWAADELARLESGRPSNHRLVAVQTLAHLASRGRSWSPELEQLLTLAKRAENPEIAELAEKALASHRAHHDSSIAKHRKERLAPARIDRRSDAMFSATDDPNPEVRWSSLHWVVEIAHSEGADSDPRILAVLTAHWSDPDPRIASFVRFALRGLAGDRNALREVYVQEGATQWEGRVQ
jgi:hypothetical protein